MGPDRGDAAGGNAAGRPRAAPEPVPVGRRARLHQRRHPPGRDRPLRPREPALAARRARRLRRGAAGRDQPVLGAVARRHAADPARLPARRRRVARRDRGGAGRHLSAADRGHGRPVVRAAGGAVADGGVRRARPRTYALAGLLLAAAILTRANLLVLLPVLALALGRKGVVFAAVALVPVLAWSINAGAPVSTGGGSSFFIGTYLPGNGTLPGAKAALKWETLRHSPELRGIAHARELPGERVLDAVAARHPGLDRDAALRAEGWRNLRTQPRAHPLAYARMLAAKLPRMWLTPSPRDDGLRTGTAAALARPARARRPRRPARPPRARRAAGVRRVPPRRGGDPALRAADPPGADRYGLRRLASSTKASSASGFASESRAAAFSARRAHQDPLDRELEHLAGERPRHRLDGDHLARDVPRRAVLAHALADLARSPRRSSDAPSRSTTNSGIHASSPSTGTSTTSASVIGVDGEHGAVDLRRAHADAAAVDGGVAAAADDRRAAVGDLDPVAVAPDAGVGLEVGLAVARAVVVAPEVDRHRRHRAGEHELADLADVRVARPGPRTRSRRPARAPAARPRRPAARARRRRTPCTGRCRRWSRTARCPVRRARRPSGSPRATAASRSSRRPSARTDHGRPRARRPPSCTRRCSSRSSRTSSSRCAPRSPTARPCPGSRASRRRAGSSPR